MIDLSSLGVMGVLNVTPDSFSDGGAFIGMQAAIDRACEMEAAGAAIIDVGGESTRPGATPVSLAEEMDRVLPVLEAICSVVSIPVSIDTSKPAVMEAAAQAGARLVNDVRALTEPGALEMAAKLDVSVCLMHMQGTPETMQKDPQYRDVVSEVHDFLAARVAAAEAMGVARNRLLVDPGFGFGKTDAHNAQLLSQLHRFGDLGLPILVGLSRKSLVGRVLGRSLEHRLAGSVAAATLATWNGASIIRAHDVAETVDAVRLVQFIRGN